MMTGMVHASCPTCGVVECSADEVTIRCCAEAMQNTAAKPSSLQDYLFDQFNLLDVTEPRQRQIGEHLIYNIDDTTGWLGYRKEEDGTFVPYTLEEVVKSMDNPCTPQEAEQVLKVIRTAIATRPKK